MRWRIDGEGEGGLHVWLFETRVHASRVRGLELRVEVGLVVDRVDESMQALAGIHVHAVGLNYDRVVGLKPGEFDPGAGEGGGRVYGSAVQCDCPHALGDEIDPGRRCCAVEDDRGGGRECGRATGQVEGHVIGRDGDGGRAVARLGAGQVLGHGRILSPVRRGATFTVAASLL